jgi:hypothetical protein
MASCTVAAGDNGGGVGEAQAVIKKNSSGHTFLFRSNLLKIVGDGLFFPFQYLLERFQNQIFRIIFWVLLEMPLQGMKWMHIKHLNYQLLPFSRII